MNQDEIEAAVREALQGVLEEQFERVLELLLKEITGLSAQVLRLQGRIELAASANAGVGASGDLSALMASAAARGGRFL